MNTKKSLAKVFGPVLLLTATLALPIDTAQAKEHGRAAAHAQADKHENHKKKAQQQKQVQKRVEVRRQQQSHRQPVVRKQVVRKQVVKNQVVRQQTARRQVARQQALQRQAALDRQAALQRQEALRLQRVRQQQVQRQQVLVRQQALDRQRALERQRALDRQRALQRQNRAYRYDDRYYAAPRARRGGGGADPNVFHVDGYLEDGGECLFLHDHEGRTWAMVGNSYGLQPGEHVRLYGRPVDAGNACGYRAAAFDIYEVKTVWADKNHKRTYYDNLYDGPFDQNRAYEDDRYYNGQYDTYEDRQERESWWDRIFGG